MKRIFSLFAILAILSSCKDLLSDDMNKEDLIEVNLSLTGDVTVKEEPLTKTFDSNDLIAIQVNRGYTPYAYGLFDDISNLKIYLHSGESYIFKAMMIKNGKNTLTLFNKKTLKYIGKYTGYLVYDGTNEGTSITSDYYVYRDGTDTGWRLLFGMYDHETNGSGGIAAVKRTDSYYEDVQDISNIFIYSARRCFDMPNRVFRPTSKLYCNSYYGEFSVSNITGNENTLSIEMKHLVYSIQCNVTGVTDGTASITIKNGDNVLLNKTDISGEYHSNDLLFSCSSLYDAWQYADNYTENVTVSMSWLRGVGVLQDLGSQVVQVKRNCKNVINVSLSTSLSSPEIIINQEE